MAYHVVTIVSSAEPVQTSIPDNPTQEINADEAGLRGSYKPVTIAGEGILLGGDVIVSVDDEEVADMGDLQALIGDNAPGQQITLTVIRDGDTIDVNVALSEQP